MWVQQNLEDFDRQFKWYTKKRPKELNATLSNLQLFLSGLQTGGKIASLMAAHRFLRKEQAGVVAVTQWGGGKNLAETRLYTFPDEATETLYLITIGDKNSQQDDVQFSKRFAQSVKEAQTNDP